MYMLFAGIYAYCCYYIERMWSVFSFLSVLILYRKHAICQRDYRPQSSLIIQYVHGNFCKHLGIDLSTDRYSNLFLNGYINRHVHAEY